MSGSELLLFVIFAILAVPATLVFVVVFVMAASAIFGRDRMLRYNVSFEVSGVLLWIIVLVGMYAWLF